MCRRRQTLVACFFFFQAEDGIRDLIVTGVQTCALPISPPGYRHGGPRDGPPYPPTLGSAPAKPWRSSIPPNARQRPGGAVALLDTPQRSAAPRQSRGTPRDVAKLSAGGWAPIRGGRASAPVAAPSAPLRKTRRCLSGIG